MPARGTAATIRQGRQIRPMESIGVRRIDSDHRHLRSSQGRQQGITAATVGEAAGQSSSTGTAPQLRHGEANQGSLNLSRQQGERTGHQGRRRGWCGPVGGLWSRATPASQGQHQGSSRDQQATGQGDGSSGHQQQGHANHISGGYRGGFGFHCFRGGRSL